MSGLSADQLEKLRGRRTPFPTFGDESSQSPKTDGDLEDNRSAGGETPASSEKPTSPLHPEKAQVFGKFKVQSYAEGSDLTALATFSNPWTSASDWSSKTLADLRKILVSHVKVEYAFCMEDKSIVPEDMPLVDYLEDTAPGKPDDAVGGEEEMTTKSKSSSEKRQSHNLIYLKEKSKPEAAEVTSIDALKKSFIIKFVDKSKETSTGSIQSSEIPVDMKKIQLGALRPYVNMSSDHSRHEFCLGDGMSVSDSMTLRAYISKGEVPSDIESDLPILTVYFQKVRSKSIFAEASDEMKESGKIDTKADLKFGDGNEKPVTAGEMAGKAADTSKLVFEESFLQSLASVKAGKYLSPAELDEMQWDTVLGNCNVMYGWKFDLNTMAVKRAPQPAFKLRKGLNLDLNSNLAPSSQIIQNESTMESEKAGSEVERNEGAEGAEGEDVDGGDVHEDGQPQDTRRDGGVEDGQPAKPPANVPVSRRKKPEALPNFAVADDSKIEITLVSSRLEESMAKNNFTASSFEVGGSANIKGVDLGGSGGKSEREEHGEGKRDTNSETLMIGNYRFPRASIFLRAEDLEPTEGLAAAIEKVRVTKSLEQLKALYDSYGHFFCEEVLIGGRLQTTRATKITDKYSVTRAKSQFKAEVGVAISIPSVASINGKYSKESGSDEEQSQQETHSSDAITFEATGGNTILTTNPPRWSESVLDHRNWRVIQRSELTPLGEALGRCSVPETRQARGWFTQAVPFLSKYIAIPESRVVPVRLKLNSKIPQLSADQPDELFNREVCHYLGHQYGKCVSPIRVDLRVRDIVKEQIQRQAPSGTKELSTLEKISMLNPIGFALQAPKLLDGGAVTSDISMIYTETETIHEIPLFSPARIQAPVALHYNESSLTAGVTPESKGRYRETVWNMVVPYGEWLKDDSLVMLTSAAGASQTFKDDVWLTVYRNAQGQFMPAMTSSGDASFWRVKKESKGSGPEISEGNTIKLTWRFSDQTSGFRDFYEDSFGRRTFNKPENVRKDELHLKLPFPGFQKTEDKNRGAGESAGLAMMMSEIETDAPFLQEVSISSKKNEGSQRRTYNLHYTSFRVDLVGNAGLGELEDYMTVGLDQSLIQSVKNTISVREEIIKQAKSTNVVDEVMDKVDQVGSALLGPVFPMISAPAKSIISKAAGFFKGIFG
ncbi:membrane attack complex component perforin (MACPF) domain-containing protein [Fusarium phyllophilum]|uniref:Membrane attack complex component perforin (MACPF) domain-containing protein n=1 Tax=Fusarium phyllophilum TaxID=47803 RepID=A0A8H5NIG4_9HYPO|nr:membrane attack complex component perforin (MACPF) domain-containing protein [Fusarium phyllophilum]